MTILLTLAILAVVILLGFALLIMQAYQLGKNDTWEMYEKDGKRYWKPKT